MQEQDNTPPSTMHHGVAKGAYPKLVRDNIPEIIKKETGHDVKTRTLTDEEFARALFQKLIEETGELVETTSYDQLIEEAADILEVLEAILREHKIDPWEVDKKQLEKRRKKGGFMKQILCLEDPNIDAT